MYSEINPHSGVSFGAILPFSCEIGIPKQELKQLHWKKEYLNLESTKTTPKKELLWSA